MLLNSTAYSQVVPDSKVDTCYCFGPTKTRQIVKNEVRVQECDEQLMNYKVQEYLYEEKLHAKDSTIAAGEKLLNRTESQRGQDTIRLETLRTQLSMANAELKTAKLKQGILWGGFGGSLLINIILSTLLIVRR